jgi:hypothetical protein
MGRNRSLDLGAPAGDEHEIWVPKIYRPPLNEKTGAWFRRYTRKWKNVFIIGFILMKWLVTYLSL